VITDGRKQIAIVAMFFLPGTSFATVLAMPFFNMNGYLTDPQRAWLWATLTVPTTCVAFSIYYFIMRQAKHSFKAMDKDSAEKMA
jgi:hypothetical protein